MTTQTDAATLVKTSDDAPHGSVTVTEGVRVEIRPEILASHTDPDERRWVFVYRVKVTNGSDRPVRIVARQWTIIDSHGDRETVEGEGVVGEQPALEPGGAFSYESFCPLGTPWGTMEGAYECGDGAGRGDGLADGGDGEAAKDDFGVVA